MNMIFNANFWYLTTLEVILVGTKKALRCTGIQINTSHTVCASKVEHCPI